MCVACWPANQRATCGANLLPYTVLFLLSDKAAECGDLNAALTSTFSSLIKATPSGPLRSTNLSIHIFNMKYDADLIGILAWSGPTDCIVFHLLPRLFIWLQHYLQYSYTLSLSLSLSRQRGFPAQAFPHSLISTPLLIQRDQDYAFNPVQDGCLQLPAHSLSLSLFFPCLPPSLCCVRSGMRGRARLLKMHDPGDRLTLQSAYLGCNRRNPCAERFAIIHCLTC